MQTIFIIIIISSSITSLFHCVILQLQIGIKYK